MIYKSFAVLTLIAAPIIVLAVQSFVPQTNQPAAIGPAMPVTPPPVPAAVPAAVAPAPVADAPVGAPPSDSASFGQPMSDAGKPSLSPGTGLPATTPPVEMPSPASNEIPQ
ncbi:hypothetical protein [Sphingobium estronivorans]|uniref:hypothetical protein n=1 Tax=Sphingobium estronivorans TaxID=1577690 RepID=UPI00123AE6C2|nr:hypothetical protein [Sphingobium estronivorans]